MPKREYPTITVGELKQHLSAFPDNWRLSFSGLEFYRLKARDVDLVAVEFNEPVYLDDDGNVRVENLER